MEESLSLAIISGVVRFLAWGAPLLIISAGLVYLGIKLIELAIIA